MTDLVSKVDAGNFISLLFTKTLDPASIDVV